MKEELVSIKTAMLAKEKGFPQIAYWYNKHATHAQAYLSDGKLYNFLHNPSFHVAMAPTQSFLQKWLRDKHSIHIDIQPFYYKSKIISWSLRLQSTYFKERYSTYEKALEAGLIAALEKLPTVK